MATNLTTALDDLDSIPYFLWDEPMTVSELIAKLRNASRPEKNRLIAKVLREARDTDVWRFVTLSEILANWDQICSMLGRRRAFWEYLINGWKEDGLIEE